MVQAMRRESLREERRRAERKEMRKMVRAAARRASRTSEQPARQGNSYDECAGLPVAHLCGSCGWLHWFKKADDPTRASNDRTPRTEACPQCMALAWHDLRDPNVAQMVLDSEIFVQQERARLRGRLIRQVLLLASTFAASAALIAKGATLTLLVLGFVITGLTIRFTKTLGQLLAERKTKAARWKTPQAADRTKLHTSEPVTCTGEPSLRAPVSGRPCLAYQLEVCWQQPQGTSFPRSALLEQRNAELRLEAGRTFAVGKDELELHLIREPVEPTTAAQRSAVELHLRQRGLSFGDGCMMLFESVIVPGDRARLLIDTAGHRSLENTRA